MELRDYQKTAINEIYEAWQSGAQNVLIQLATGGGKTVVLSYIIAHHPGSSIAIAHRVELVSQLSLTLARHGIRHNIVASRAAIREIVSIHMNELGKSYFSPRAKCTVAGVDTLIRLPENTPWFRDISLVVIDEAHHVLRKNKWGKAVSLFPLAKGLFPTATPVRADGAGLGRHADGVVDKLVVGVPMRELIQRGYLTDYRIFAPPNNLDLSEVTLSASGDYSPPKLRNAVHKSHITGDIVSHYLRIAKGKQGVTFAVDVEAATEIATEFNARGVPAEIVSGKTPDLLRSHIMRKFREGTLKQLVNVDILGEGVDVPAIEVISMARPTQSYSLFSQQFGRSLRPMPDKTHAIIIDHVGNTLLHGLPDASRAWSLDRKASKKRNAPDDAIPLRVCLNPECLGVYPRTKRVCPNCGFFSDPKGRSSPQEVDGDLFELDPEILAKLRGEIDRVDEAPKIPQYLAVPAQLAIAKRHKQRQETQNVLRETISLWAGHLKYRGKSDSEMYRTFYHTFKIDVMSAQALNVSEATELNNKIIDNISTMEDPI